MIELTADQKRVLDYIDYFDFATINEIKADLRPAFLELEALGLIEQFTKYQLTDAGRKAIPVDVGGVRHD